MLLKIAVLTIVLAVIIPQIFSRPPQINSNHEILKYRNNKQEDGYQFEYEAQDGTKREESGHLEEVNGRPVLRVKGSYSYFDESGRHYVVYYEAGEEGTKTRGDIIPSLTTVTTEKGEESNTTLPEDLVVEPVIGTAAIQSLTGAGKK